MPISTQPKKKDYDLLLCLYVHELNTCLQALVWLASNVSSCQKQTKSMCLCVFQVKNKLKLLRAKPNQNKASKTGKGESAYCSTVVYHVVTARLFSTLRSLYPFKCSSVLSAVQQQHICGSSETWPSHRGHMKLKALGTLHIGM